MKKQIIVVDDETFNRTILSFHLTSQGYNVVLKENGIAGLEYIFTSSIPVDIILLDFLMPDMDGIEFLCRLKAHPVFNTIPVILQTGFKDDSIVKLAYKLGISECIYKPYNRKTINQIISKWIDVC